MARVTIVGGGYGGITAAKALDDVAEVTLVEQKDTFVSHAAALRAAVDRDWAEKIFLPYDKLLTNGRIVHGTALTVRGTTVEVSGHGQIEADYLVLATGTAYPFPAKHMESSSVIAKARIERVHANLEQSSRVLILGAGAVGIELAGEITSAFPQVKVTMLEAADRILPAGDYKPEIREAIADQLTQRGVEILTGDSLSFLPPVDVGVLSPFRVTTQGGRQLEADMWFRAYGSAAATGFLSEDYDEVRHYDGTIRVDEYLRVVDHPGVWAIGDITDVRESKRADAARQQARVVIANITAQIEGEEPDAHYVPTKEWVILPLGPNMGASQLLDSDGQTRILGADQTAEIKGTDLMVSVIRSQLNLP